VEVAIHGLEGIPLFNADDESAHGLPPAVISLREALAEADALLVAPRVQLLYERCPQ